ncbi:LONRF2 [Cordylochernes scorpioides]|uniref:LONRF2 n=1 Tax=Cordylochernes scorpioides TaxID=51811 RepID=A0ABY6JUZ0_9ARAC|nr:LONRF2 [Cordylochernes scorpioides]
MPLHQPRVTVWCGFTSFLLLGHFSLKKSMEELLKPFLKAIPILQDKQPLSEIAFMQEGGPPPISRGAKQLLKDTLGEDRVISRHFIHQWPSRSPDLTPCDFGLWGYIKSRVYRCRPTTSCLLSDGTFHQFQQIYYLMLFNLSSIVCRRCLRIKGATLSKDCDLIQERRQLPHPSNQQKKKRREFQITSMEKIERAHSKLSPNHSHMESDPDNHVAQVALARTVSNPEEALQLVDTALRSEPPWAKAHELRGELLQRQKRVEEASVAYLLALYLNPRLKHLKQELKQIFGRILQADMEEETWAPAWRERSGSSGSLCSFTSSCSDLSCDDEGQEFKLTHGQDQILGIISKFFMKAEAISSFTSPKWTKFKASSVDKKDFECPLCFRFFWQPVSTTCGHTFCRTCLVRSLDHKPLCPLCKSSLEQVSHRLTGCSCQDADLWCSQFQQERAFSVSAFLDQAMQLLMPYDYEERHRSYCEELEEFANASKASRPVVPLFVCTMAYPTMPCPLHVFEPQYRHMIRRCLEAGTQEFGMCPHSPDQDYGLPDYGTILRIRELQYLPDGRAVVNAVGTRRFHILRKGMTDGYHTGEVEFLKDVPPDDLQRLETLHDEVRAEALSWFSSLPETTRLQALQHFGPFPGADRNELTSSDGPAWCWWLAALLPLHHRHLTALLAMTSLPRRLETFHRILSLTKFENYTANVSFEQKIEIYFKEEITIISNLRYSQFILSYFIPKLAFISEFPSPIRHLGTRPIAVSSAKGSPHLVTCADWWGWTFARIRGNIQILSSLPSPHLNETEYIALADQFPADLELGRIISTKLCS